MAFSGSKFFYIDAAGGSAGNEAGLYSPLIDISGLSNPALRFYCHMFGSEMGELHVDVHDGTNWVSDVRVIAEEQQTADTDPWESKTITLSGYPGTIQIRFRAVRNGNLGDIALDDIEIIDATSCFQPYNLSVSNTTDTTAELDWNHNGTTTWDIHVVATGSPAPNASTTSTDPGIVNKPFFKTGLSPNSNYEFYVRSDCGSGNLSSWAGPFDFSTNCSGYGAFAENFDALPDGGFPVCWTPWGNSQYNSVGVESDVSYDPQRFSPPNSLEFFSNFGELIAVTPYLSDLSTGTHQIRFRAIGTNESSLIVGTMSDPYDETTFVPIKTIPISENYLEYVVPFAPTSHNYAAFRVTGTDSSQRVNIDDVFWEPIPSCSMPNTLAVTYITTTTADLDWAETGTASAWDVYVVA